MLVMRRMSPGMSVPRKSVKSPEIYRARGAMWSDPFRKQKNHSERTKPPLLPVVRGCFQKRN